MVMRAALLVVLPAMVVLGACHPRAARRPAPVSHGDELTLYRDRAVVKQRVEVDIPTASTVTVTVKLAVGVEIEDVVVLDRGELGVSELRAGDVPAHPAADAKPTKKNDPEPDAEETAEEGGGIEAPVVPPSPTAPTEVTFVVSGPHAGHYALSLGYITDRIKWDAAYTMTTTSLRRRVSLRGAIAIRNMSGISFARIQVFVVDLELGAWRGRVAEQFGGLLAGAPASTTPGAQPRSLGTIALGTGETRIELLPGDPARPMHSVLVYDPIGTKLDHSGSAPIRDLALGVTPLAGSRVTESFEIERAQAASAGLPGGPVRLLERRADGSLAVLGETRLFDAATRVAGVDTVAIGTADGVTGVRERREISIDDDGKRLVEEFVLTLTNKRATPVEVVLREHLYRGQNWTLAYHSALDADKEGPQQISMRTKVPPHGETKVLYVVVYTWEPSAK
jgi:hypothetical protein